MSKFKKALDRLRNNPKNVRFEEIDSLLLGLGFEKRQKGSHVTYTRHDLKDIITIPIHKPFILPVYVKTLIQIIDQIESKE